MYSGNFYLALPARLQSTNTCSLTNPIYYEEENEKICLICVLLNSTVQAGVWKGNYDITQLVVEGANYQPIANFSLSPQPEATETGCDDNSFVTMLTSNEKGKQALSVMLMAIATNKKLRVYFDGCTGTRPNITRVWIVN